jgi:hypothetical protein
MHLRLPSRIDVLAVCARAQEVCLEVQQTRRLAAQARHRALLTRLARYMPQANLLTRAITAEILTQHGLFTPAPTDLGRAVSPFVSSRSHAMRR